MAALDQSTLRDAIRRFCGNPLGDGGEVDAEVTDDDIDRFIGWAVRDIVRSLAGKKVKIDYFTTVADQQAYDIPDGVGEIIDVHWVGAETAVNTRFSADIPYYVWPEYPLAESPGHRSLGVISEIQNKEIAVLSSLAYSWDIRDGKIYLDPTPSSSGEKVYYEYVEDTKDLSELDDTYERAIMLRAAYYVFGQMIAARDNKAQVGTTGFQNITQLSQLQILRDRIKLDFDDEITMLSRRNVG